MSINRSLKYVDHFFPWSLGMVFDRHISNDKNLLLIRILITKIHLIFQITCMSYS